MRLPEVQHHEDPQTRVDAVPEYPYRMALRNAGVGVAGITVVGAGLWWKTYHSGDKGGIYWWMWVAAAVFTIAMTFLHAFIALRFGARRAENFAKVLAGLALAAIFAGLWWYMQPKNGGV